MRRRESTSKDDEELPPLHSLVRISREMAYLADPADALWGVIRALCDDLSVDRAGVFAYDPDTNELTLVVGVDESGKPEFSASRYPLDVEVSPLKQVARREIPYYFS